MLVDRLEGIQEKYIRLMLEVPVSTPKVALRAETGLLSMKHRIWNEKVNLYLPLKKMKDGLARQVLEEQIDHGWPGLAREVGEIGDRIGVQNMNSISNQSLKLALRHMTEER